MKIRKYITGNLVIKFGLFLVLLAGAWIFDEYHDGNPVVSKESPKPDSVPQRDALTFFCTTQSPVSIKTPVQKAGTDKSTREKLDRLIREQLNARSVFLHKAEVYRQPNSCLTLRNLISYRYHFICYSDNTPPAA